MRQVCTKGCAWWGPGTRRRAAPDQPCWWNADLACILGAIQPRSGCVRSSNLLRCRLARLACGFSGSLRRAVQRAGEVTRSLRSRVRHGGCVLRVSQLKGERVRL